MTSTTPLRIVLTATTIALFGTLGSLQGCVINAVSVDCNECDESPLCHNHVGDDGQCHCDAGYTWENPDDDDNLECERVPPRPGGSECNESYHVLQGDFCYCIDGYTWANPNDANDLTCVADDAQDTVAVTDTDTDTAVSTSEETTLGSESLTTTDTDTDTDTDATTPSGDCYDIELVDAGKPPKPFEIPPDELCTKDGLRACSNDDPNNLEGSILWVCTGGTWVESDDVLAADCIDQGADFSYGCFDDPEAKGVQVVCGIGPGTPCEEDDDTTCEGDVLSVCRHERLTDFDCAAFCTGTHPFEEADQTYDFGVCDAPVCVCCNEI